MDELAPQELNKFLSEFLITVRKKEDNGEYEPNSLRAFFASFERHLKKKKLWTLPYERRPVRTKSAIQSNEKCPVKTYKFYAEKRPAEMNTDDAPFYLAVNKVKSGSGRRWFKKAPVGVNKLKTLMKTMAQKAGLGPNFKNHSGRKTMIQTLVNNDVPPTDILQLSGHKNVQSITNYSTVSQKQQSNMSHTLTRLSSGEIAPQSGSSIPERRKHEFDQYSPGTFRPTFFSGKRASSTAAPFSFFGCCYKRKTY